MLSKSMKQECKKGIFLLFMGQPLGDRFTVVDHEVQRLCWIAKSLATDAKLRNSYFCWHKNTTGLQAMGTFTGLSRDCFVSAD